LYSACSGRVIFPMVENLNINGSSVECFNVHHKISAIVSDRSIDRFFNDLRSMVTIPSVSGLARTYLLQKSLDVNRVNQTEPIIEPIAKPVVLHMDAYPTLFLCKYILGNGLKHAKRVLYIRNLQKLMTPTFSALKVPNRQQLCLAWPPRRWRRKTRTLVSLCLVFPFRAASHRCHWLCKGRMILFEKNAIWFC